MKTGRKPLSVFLSVILVLSTFLFVLIPGEAHAEPGDVNRTDQPVAASDPAADEDDPAHVWVADEQGQTIPSTCKTQGSQDQVCTHCAEKRTIQLPLDPDNHESEETTRVRAAEPSCGANGYTGDLIHLCCGAVIEYGRSIPATGQHHFSKSVKVDSTCVSQGYQLYICDDCGATIYDYFELDPDNHEQEPVLVGQKENTCGEDGYTGDLTCPACGVVLEEGTVIPATGVHTYRGEFIQNATASHSGIKRFTCTGCGKFYDEDVEWMGEHKHEGGEEYANCVQRARCEKCGAPYGNYASNVHLAPQVPVEAVPPTCTEQGHGEGVICSACHAYITPPEILAPLGHTDTDKDGVCDACGEEVPLPFDVDTFRCSLCDTYEMYKDTPVIGTLYKVIHTIIHFLEGLFAENHIGSAA